MKDYIERDKVLKDLLDQCKITGYGGLTPNDIKYVFSLQTNADVRPVVRGEWVAYPECLKYPNAYSDDHIVCSVCEECFSILDNDCERFNFCPNCGSYNGGDGDDQH